MTSPWSTLAEPVEQTQDDPATASLLAIIPADRREMFAPALRGMLANIRAQVSEGEYLIYCQTLKRGHELYEAGDHDGARQIFEGYGLPYDLMVKALE